LSEISWLFGVPFSLVVLAGLRPAAVEDVCCRGATAAYILHLGDTLACSEQSGHERHFRNAKKLSEIHSEIGAPF